MPIVFLTFCYLFLQLICKSYCLVHLPGPLWHGETEEGVCKGQQGHQQPMHGHMWHHVQCELKSGPDVIPSKVLPTRGRSHEGGSPAHLGGNWPGCRGMQLPHGGRDKSMLDISVTYCFLLIHAFTDIGTPWPSSKSSLCEAERSSS